MMLTDKLTIYTQLCMAVYTIEAQDNLLSRIVGRYGKCLLIKERFIMFDGKPLHSRFAGYLNSSPPTFWRVLK